MIGVLIDFDALMISLIRGTPRVMSGAWSRITTKLAWSIICCFLTVVCYAITNLFIDYLGQNLAQICLHCMSEPTQCIHFLTGVFSFQPVPHHWYIISHIINIINIFNAKKQTMGH